MIKVIFYLMKTFYELAKKLNKIIDTLEPKTFVPYSESVPWGYGNLIENKEILSIYNLKKFMNKASSFLEKGNLICNHLLVTNKALLLARMLNGIKNFLI